VPLLTISIGLAGCVAAFGRVRVALGLRTIP
jgi:hypothetical protein